MKQITAVFRPHRLEQVERALHALPHLPGFTIHLAQGHARGHGTDHGFIPDEWKPDAHDSLVLVVFCTDSHAVDLVEAVAGAARTGQPGDGMIAVAELTELVRIRTGERGEAAA